MNQTTRARLRCVLFSSVVSDEIRIEPGSPRGVKALKRYLEYAEQGTLPVDIEPFGDFDSPFEKSVYDALQEAGWEVHSQVGCAGFAIDLAVIDPKAQGRYLCGIECDGATYHSSATARDRDRLRQAVLEDLGWKIIRIWSTDWYHQPDITFKRLLEQVTSVASEPAVHGTTDAEAPPSAAGWESSLDEAKETKPSREEASSYADHGPKGPPPGFVPYERFKGGMRGHREGLLRMPIAELAEFLTDIVDVEGPIHRDELLRIAAGHYRVRVTGTVKEALDKALDHALVNDLVRHGQFVWPRSMKRPAIRWRGTKDAVSAAELICPEEVAEAAV